MKSRGRLHNLEERSSVGVKFFLCLSDHALCLSDHASQYKLSNNQFDAKYIYFIISLLHCSTCFEHYHAHHQTAVLSQPMHRTAAYRE
jgi:hypothetical protein